jgi:hypothetical protein
MCVLNSSGSQDSTVGLATGYGLEGWGAGIRILVRARFLSSPRRPDRFWGPLRRLSYG